MTANDRTHGLKARNTADKGDVWPDWQGKIIFLVSRELDRILLFPSQFEWIGLASHNRCPLSEISSSSGSSLPDVP